jgi:serine/threonine-protein kinase HipA
VVKSRAWLLTLGAFGGILGVVGEGKNKILLKISYIPAMAKSQQNSAFVFYNNILAGTLRKLPMGYEFQYSKSYLDNPGYPPIAFSLPRQDNVFYSQVLFPFFYGLLSEGSNRQIQEKLLKIDSRDHFTLLIKTANSDTIGAVTVREHL